MNVEPLLVVDIAFDCVPLRSLGRLNAPLEGREAAQRQVARAKAALARFGAERTYLLENARCVFHFANSEVEGACRFEFDGAVHTDAGDRKCDETMLEVRLVSDTCGGVPAAVEGWLAERVRQAVAIEFDRFIAAGQLATRTDEQNSPEVEVTASYLFGRDV